MGVPWTKKINKQKDICPVINVDKPNPKSLTNQKKKVILAHIGDGVLVSDWEVLGECKNVPGLKHVSIVFSVCD